jgi:hypothetical protein
MLTTGTTYAITVAPLNASGWGLFTPTGTYTTGVANVTGMVTGMYAGTLTSNNSFPLGAGVGSPPIGLRY